MHFVPCRHLSASQSAYIHIGISGNDGIQSWGLLVVPASIMHSGIIVVRKSLIVRERSDPKVFLCTCKRNIRQNNYKAAVSVAGAMKMTPPGKSDVHSIVV